MEIRLHGVRYAFDIDILVSKTESDVIGVWYGFNMNVLYSGTDNEATCHLIWF
jgi:hypothetical protein